MRLRDNFMPYASIGSVLTVIEQLRERGGLPEQVSISWLSKIGITDATAERVHQALRFLGLLDEEGRRTEEATRLKTSSSEEYPKVLAELVRRAYQPVFAVIGQDLSNLDPARLKDAFRGCEPFSQSDRMISLFQGLLQEAGLVEGGPVPRQVRARRALEKKREATSNGRFGESSAPPAARSIATEPAPPQATNTLPPSSDQPSRDTSPLGQATYELLEAALRQLPPDARWTKAKRDRWIAAVTTGVDLLVEVVESEAPSFGPQHIGARFGKALWRRQDGDEPVTVVGYLGRHEGREYVGIAESTTGVPLDEIVYDEAG